jgi:glycosyltransferase involved in cell wall biosynthesis
MNTVTGLGPVFVRRNATSKILRSVLIRILRVCFRAKGSRIVVQNEDDRELLIGAKIASAEKTSVILGFGVDTGHYVPSPEPDGEFVVMMPTRMLWEKGVGEFVEAGRELRRRDASVRMVLVGAPDTNNPGCIPEQKLREWAASGSVEWWGHQEDMPSVLGRSHVVCLPSYREGLPKVLLEAGACERAVVTTDVAGCREVVRNEVNGLLVPARDSKALGAAIRRLLEDAKLRRRLAAAGRERAEREFSSEIILASTLELYGAVLGDKWPGRPGTDAAASKAAAGVLSQV